MCICYEKSDHEWFSVVFWIYPEIKNIRDLKSKGCLKCFLANFIIVSWLKLEKVIAKLFIIANATITQQNTKDEGTLNDILVRNFETATVLSFCAIILCIDMMVCHKRWNIPICCWNINIMHILITNQERRVLTCAFFLGGLFHDMEMLSTLMARWERNSYSSHRTLWYFLWS